MRHCPRSSRRVLIFLLCWAALWMPAGASLAAAVAIDVPESRGGMRAPMVFEKSMISLGDKLAQRPPHIIIRPDDFAPVTEMDWVVLPRKLRVFCKVIIDVANGKVCTAARDLELSRAQIGQIDKLCSDVTERIRTLVADLQDKQKDGEITMQQKNRALVELALGQRQVANTSLRKILNRHQSARLALLETLFIIDSRRGPLGPWDALETAELMGILEFTDTQQRDLVAALAAARTALNGPVEDPTEFDPLKPGAIEAERRAKDKRLGAVLVPVVKILTAEQRKTVKMLFSYNVQFVNPGK